MAKGGEEKSIQVCLACKAGPAANTSFCNTAEEYVLNKRMTILL